MSDPAPAALPIPAPDELPEAEREARTEAEWLVSLGEEVHVDLARPAEALVDSAAANLNTAATRVAVAGLELLAARSRTPHGQFQALVEARGIRYREAARAMAIARWLTRLPKVTTLSLLRAAPTKLGELARLDPAELEALEAEGETDTEGLLALPQRDLAAMVRRLRREKRAIQERMEAVEAPPGSKEAWRIEAERVQGEVSGLVGEIAARAHRIEALVTQFRAHPGTANPRTRRKWTGGIRLALGHVDDAWGAVRAGIEGPLERIEGGG